MRVDKPCNNWRFMPPQVPWQIYWSSCSFRFSFKSKETQGLCDCDIRAANAWRGFRHVVPALHLFILAGVAQLVERQLPKLNVEGSSPFSRFETRHTPACLINPLFTGNPCHNPLSANRNAISLHKSRLQFAFVSHGDLFIVLSELFIPKSRCTPLIRNTGLVSCLGLRILAVAHFTVDQSRLSNGGNDQWNYFHNSKGILFKIQGYKK